MAKTLLGIDIGYDSLKLALVSGTQVKKTATVPMPVRLVKEGRVVSVETMGETLREAVRANGLRCRNAAVAFPNETVFIRNVTLPAMSEDLLKTNLPYEFRDYIVDELKNYTFDYETLSSEISETEEGEKVMNLLAVAAPNSLIEETREFLRKGGMQLAVAAPTVSAFKNVLQNSKVDPEKEYCILDLGNRAVRMHVFRGSQYSTTRALETGMNVLDDVISEKFNVDTHLAHTYLLTDYESCQSCEECVAAYNNITVELMRTINFYRFSNPENNLEDVYLSGGGAAISAFDKAVESTLRLNVHHASELIGGGEKIENCDSLVQAIGIAMS